MNEIKDFPWRPGMRYSMPGSPPVRLTARGESVRNVGAVMVFRPGRAVEWPPPMGATPDFTDPATVGALAGAVRELYSEPRMFVIAIPGGWAICRGAMHAMFEPDGLLADGTWDCDFLGDAPKYMHADTEPEAWLAAYHAAKGRQA